MKEYDYSMPGGYFVTINTKERGNFLGNMIQEKMILNEYGIIVQETWNELIHHINNIELDMFTVMLNHVHGIIIILDSPVRAGLEPALTGAACGFAGSGEAVQNIFCTEN